MGNNGTGCFNTGDGVTKGESAVQTHPCLLSASSVVTVIKGKCVKITAASEHAMCFCATAAIHTCGWEFNVCDATSASELR